MPQVEHSRTAEVTKTSTHWMLRQTHSWWSHHRRLDDGNWVTEDRLATILTYYKLKKKKKPWGLVCVQMAGNMRLLMKIMNC